MLKLLRVAAGIFLVLLGVAGLILPILPGFIFLIPGLVILGEYFPPAQRLLDWLKLKYEAARARMPSDDSATMK